MRMEEFKQLRGDARKEYLRELREVVGFYDKIPVWRKKVIENLSEKH